MKNYISPVLRVFFCKLAAGSLLPQLQPNQVNENVIKYIENTHFQEKKNS